MAILVCCIFAYTYQLFKLHYSLSFTFSFTSGHRHRIRKRMLYNNFCELVLFVDLLLFTYFRENLTIQVICETKLDLIFGSGE